MHSGTDLPTKQRSTLRVGVGFAVASQNKYDWYKSADNLGVFLHGLLFPVSWGVSNLYAFVEVGVDQPFEKPSTYISLADDDLGLCCVTLDMSC